MNIREKFFLSIPFFVYLILCFFPTLWIHFDLIRFNLVASVSFIIIWFFLADKILLIPEHILSFTTYILFIISVLFAIFFPVNDLKLGDGILLIENLLLESELFGINLIPDEILEGLIHSIFYFYTKQYTSDPILPYKILSYISGFFLIVLVYNNFLKPNFSLIVLLLGSGSILLYYGYMEHYSITTLLLFSMLIYGINTIESNENTIKSIMIISILASIAFLHHLISGFFILGLVYFAYEKSNDLKSFFINSSIGIIIASIFIFPLYFYFIFFAETRIDLRLAHIAHPPFLKFSSILSLIHLKELFIEIIWVSAPGLFTIVYFFIFEKKTFSLLLFSPKGKFLSYSFFGILINFLSFNPLLGYPADWDVMSFVWIPIFLFSLILLTENIKIFKKLFFFYIFCFIMINSKVPYLTLKENQKIQINELVDEIKNYNSSNTTKKNIPAQYKKFYHHSNFFLFRTSNKLNSIDGYDDLKTINAELKSEINMEELFYNKEKYKLFWNKATKFHIDYLKIEFNSSTKY
jgi:hypothetical protein